MRFSLELSKCNKSTWHSATLINIPTFFPHLFACAVQLPTRLLPISCKQQKVWPQSFSPHIKQIYVGIADSEVSKLFEVDFDLQLKADF